MMFEAVVEPVLVALETDQHAGRLSVTGDKDLLRLRQTEEPGKVVFDLSEGHLANPASRAQQATAPLRLS